MESYSEESDNIISDILDEKIMFKPFDWNNIFNGPLPSFQEYDYRATDDNTEGQPKFGDYLKIVNEIGAKKEAESRSSINKKRGRKKKDSNEKGKHTKESEDNMIKIIKNNYLKAFLLFLNLLINSFYTYEEKKELIPNSKKFLKKDLEDLLKKLNYAYDI